MPRDTKEFEDVPRVEPRESTALCALVADYESGRLDAAALIAEVVHLIVGDDTPPWLFNDIADVAGGAILDPCIGALFTRPSNTRQN
jgi:hypothetical protein